ncbi:MAG: aldose 1-epimerase family protein, partial [Planctomycetes bacterium]|nr:aldose 1-epimerase family protein [Planctomycetota bacterium]
LDRGGIGWLQGFDEVICRCGLDSNGAPGEDVVIDNNGNRMKVNLSLHGKIANLPAHHVTVEAQTQPPYEIAVIGHVEESALFCPQLELRTRISTRPGSNRLTISDEVVNLKATASELELVYHCNFGPPFLDPGARLVAPIREVAPRDARATEGIGHFDTYLAPTTGYVEQVYWYDLIAAPSTHQTLAAMSNSTGDRAVVLRYDKRQLPCFTQWKNTQAIADGYVTGLEPGTNYPNPRRFERQQGRVVRIEPGKSYSAEVTVEVCSTREQVSAIEKEVATISGQTRPEIHAKPQPKYSPV